MPVWVGRFLPVCRNTSALSKALPLDWAYGTERAYRNCKQHPFVDMEKKQESKIIRVSELKSLQMLIKLYI